MILKNSIEQLIQGKNLEAVVCKEVLHEILHHPTNPVQIAAFLVLLRSKPETAQELAAIVTELKNAMIPVPTQHSVLDIVGTGGDGMNTVNISTGSAILAASCGAKVAKHGNHAVSSLAGSADVLEALGININLTPVQVARCIDVVGIGFCYSPTFHPLMRALKPLRQQLNVPTTFNLLGPLLNPARAKHTVLGVMDPALMPKMADVLMQTGSERSVVIHGCQLDEISCLGPAKIIEVRKNARYQFELDPNVLGFPTCTLAELQGGDAAYNAKLLRKAFEGEAPAIANTLILNAALGLYVYGMADTILEATELAQTSLQNGEPLTLLKRWIAFSNEQ